MPDLGKRIRALREEKGLTLEDAGEQLNIKCEDLLALEEENFLSFPDRQFAITVLELYATFLGMNKEEADWEFSEIWPEYGGLKAIFKKRGRKRTKEILATETAEIIKETDPNDVQSGQNDPVEVKPQESSTRELVSIPEVSAKADKDAFIEGLLPEEVVLVEAAVSKEAGSSKRRFPIAAVVVIVLAVGAFAFWQTQTPVGDSPPGGTDNPIEQASLGETTNAEEGSQPETVVNEEPPKEDLGSLLKPDDIKTQTVEENSISLEITTPKGECWVEVVADGEQIYYRLVPANTRPLTFKANDEISVLIGDAAAARLECNGEDLGGLGDRGIVIKRVFKSED